jgi:hypothetical protein
MAKRKMMKGRRSREGGVTKASVIREVFGEDSSLGPTAVAEAVAQKLGIASSPTLVSQCSSLINKIKSGGDKKKRGKKPGRKPAAAHASNGLDSAVVFAQQVGGLEQAKALILTLETIKLKL